MRNFIAPNKSRYVLVILTTTAAVLPPPGATKGGRQNNWKEMDMKNIIYESS